MTTNSRFRFVGALLIALAGLCSACGVETIVQSLDEKEANRIIELLDDHGITAVKQVKDTGREVTFAIAVPGKHRLNAIRLLNKHELPRRKTRGYGEVFQESGLIPTSAEEKAKQLSAVEGEIERQLKLIEGILDVQVQIVLPDESPLRTTRDQQIPTTASVTIKYLRGGGGPPITETEVQALVAAGVEKLTAENVVVVMRPAGVIGKDAAKAAASAGVAKRAKLLQQIVIVAGGVIVFFGIVILFLFMRLRNVRARLVRLQTEIAKARRKPGDAAAA